jgi:ABC-type glycerol-3-phosphate transport system substrate-binding protein
MTRLTWKDLHLRAENEVSAVPTDLPHLLPAVAGALLLLTLLAACGGGLPDTPFGLDVQSSPTPTVTPAPTDTTTSTPTPASPDTPTPLPSPTPVPTHTLTLWTSEQGAALELARTLVDEFCAQSPLTITVVPRSTDNLRVALLTADLVGEAPPDIIWGNQDDLAELLTDEQVQPVGDLVGAGEFLPGLVMSATYDNRLWGVPLAADDSLLLMYNRALVQQPPATTDELIAISRAFDEQENYGLVAAWEEGRWLLAWLNGMGGAPTTPDGTQPTLETPQMVAALDLWSELRSSAPPGQYSYAEASESFAAGQAALTIDGSWALPLYRQADPPPDLGIAPLPRVPATGQLAAPTLNGSYIMLHRSLSGESLDYTRAFVGYLTRPEVQARVAAATERLPALRAVLDVPAVTTDPALAAAAVQAETAPGLPPTRAARCALQAINGQLADLLDEEIDRDHEEAAQLMQQEAEFCTSR